MKKILLLFTLTFISLISKAQEASVEKSIYGVQIGLVGIYGYGEYKLSNSFALRTELGYDAGPQYLDPDNSRSSITFSPVLSVESRWYYNLKRRVEKNKRIDHNSGNFLSLKISYDPDFLVLSTTNRSTFVPNELSIIPTYGVRRNIGKKFNYETGFGLGYLRILNNNFADNSGLAMNLYLRIGLGF